ncbi:MAG TPA: hypothetical protein PKL69_07355 [Agitococcus sp.]|nr:hypothetical protein [Agitococcus sp.]HNL80148.1 hypothetical protein [Agitococcus sp.]
MDTVSLLAQIEQLKEQLTKANNLLKEAESALILHLGYCKGTQIPNHASQVNNKITTYLVALFLDIAVGH